MWWDFVQCVREEKELSNSKVRTVGLGCLYKLSKGHSMRLKTLKCFGFNEWLWFAVWFSTLLSYDIFPRGCVTKIHSLFFGSDGPKHQSINQYIFYYYNNNQGLVCSSKNKSRLSFEVFRVGYEYSTN